jgi:HK97 family phage prohead protease
LRDVLKAVRETADSVGEWSDNTLGALLEAIEGAARYDVGDSYFQGVWDYRDDPEGVIFGSWYGQTVRRSSGSRRSARSTAPRARRCSAPTPTSSRSAGRHRPMPETRPLLEWRKQKAESLKGLERRVFATGDVEIREADDGTLHLTGYASVTETPYEVGFYTETIKRGAFGRTLSESPDVVLLLNHEGLPLARTKAGTLRLSEDDVGLRTEADLDPEDPDTIRLKRKRDRGDLDGQMSMAFQVTSQRWDEDYTRREITSLSLARGDVSVVTHGASPTTSSSIRGANAMAALADLGNEVIVSALVEWRDYTLLPPERREGKTLSAATREVLSNVAGMIDDAGGLLDDLLAVSIPESDDGEATVERSITNEKGLCAAIRAVAREPGQDERRAEIITRAAELKLPGLIPGGWTAAGSLPEGRALTGQEQRETFNDTLFALQEAVEEKFVDNGDYWYVWVQDFTATDVIFYAGGDLWSAPYTLVPGGAVTVGEAVGVRPVTEYVQTGEAEADEPKVAVDELPAGDDEYLSMPDLTTRAAQDLDLLRLRGGRR